MSQEEETLYMCWKVSESSLRYISHPSIPWDQFNLSELDIIAIFLRILGFKSRQTQHLTLEWKRIYSIAGRDMSQRDLSFLNNPFWFFFFPRGVKKDTATVFNRVTNKITCTARMIYRAEIIYVSLKFILN